MQDCLFFCSFVPAHIINKPLVRHIGTHEPCSVVDDLTWIRAHTRGFSLVSLNVFGLPACMSTFSMTLLQHGARMKRKRVVRGARSCSFDPVFASLWPSVFERLLPKLSCSEKASLCMCGDAMFSSNHDLRRSQNTLMFIREEQDACREGQGSYKTRYGRVPSEGQATQVDVLCLTSQ